MSQKVQTPNVGLVVLTGDEQRIARNRTALCRELGTQAYRITEVSMITEHEAEKILYTVLICHCGFSSEVHISNPVNDIAWLCFVTTPRDVEEHQSPFNAKMPTGEFLKSIPWVWAPRTTKELGIALDILGLRNQASI